nr:hypothetical protein [Lysinibacillus timonensis]
MSTTATKERKQSTTTRKKSTSTTKKKKTVSKHLTLLESKFEIALNLLDEAKPLAKSLYQTDVFQLAVELAASREGISIIDKYAHLFDQAGLFQYGEWEDLTKLEPQFVGGSLRVRSIYSIIELLSEMRILAIAKGAYKHEHFTKEKAITFLNEVMALNLDLLSPIEMVEKTIQPEAHIIRAYHLLTYLGEELSYKSVAEKIVHEIERLTVQRPIITHRIVELIQTSQTLNHTDMDEETADSLTKYSQAIDAPTPISQEVSNQREYRLRLERATDEELMAEAQIFVSSMNQTGLVSPFHAVFIRFLNRKNHKILLTALALTDLGTESFHNYPKFIHDLIQISIYPETCQSIYGLAKLLNRGVLKTDGVALAIRELFELPIHSQVSKLLKENKHEQSGIRVNGILVAGVISVLGQPLGIGQGTHPICQSARAISLWSQFDIRKLLSFVTSVVRDHNLVMSFEGELIHSSLLLNDFESEDKEDLDPISVVLVPHLDKIYHQMMNRTLLRGEDGHKWVNREFYGYYIPSGFIHVIDPLTIQVSNYASFVKLFYASHHPDYNEGNKLIYPNPVGIFLTNVHGDLLGLHAVSIQRIMKDQNGDVRIYFYNPNNDRTQNWGQDIKPSVAGFGEEEGESSLLFHQFVSRLYAYHYNPYEQGDTFMVEDSLVEKIEALAKNSWGKTYEWA